MAKAKKIKKLRLILPAKKYLDSFARGIEDARPEGTEALASHFRIFKTKKDFPTYLKKTIDDRRGVNLEKGHVPQTIYWAMVGDKFVGVLKLRHRLWKENIASHIGYAVIPSERKKGYATEMLRLGLRKAKKLGIKKVILGCRVDNIPSKKVIVSNGGVVLQTYDKKGVPKLRFAIENK